MKEHIDRFLQMVERKREARNRRRARRYWQARYRNRRTGEVVDVDDLGRCRLSRPRLSRAEWSEAA